MLFTDNIKSTLLDALHLRISKAKALNFAVAFMKFSGLHLIEECLKECLKNNGKAEFLVGLDFKTTEPSALRILNGMSKSGMNLKLFCFSDPVTDDAPVYHPKIYIIRGAANVLVSIGSSNLTAGGLRDNVEVNAIIKAKIRDEIVSDVYGLYNRLKSQQYKFEPDAEYIEEYEKLYKIVQKKNKQILQKPEIKSKIIELKEKESTLLKPALTVDDLFGWQKLVYERIPEVEVFRTSDMYDYELEFQKYYPANKHIRDKIRQILQQLRDIKILKHISEDKWSKI